MKIPADDRREYWMDHGSSDGDVFRVLIPDDGSFHLYEIRCALAFEAERVEIGLAMKWALIKDEEIYNKMLRYAQLNTLGFSHESQLRALKLLKVVFQGEGRDIFQFGYATMSNRWRKLNAVFSLSRRFSLQKVAPQYCTYFQKIREPSPAYAWLKCEIKEDEDCYGVLEGAGISSHTGSFYGAPSRYVRLSLLKSEDDFNWLLHRISALVAQEAVKSTRKI